MKLMYMLAVLLALLALNGCGNDQAKKAAEAAGFREGKEEGYSEGYQRGRTAGYLDGKRAGKAAGHKEGYAAGLAEGLEKYKPGSASILSGPQLSILYWIAHGFLSGKFEETVGGRRPVMVGDFSQKAEASGSVDPRAALRRARVKRANGAGLGPR